MASTTWYNHFVVLLRISTLSESCVPGGARLSILIDENWMHVNFFYSRAVRLGSSLHCFLAELFAFV